MASYKDQYLINKSNLDALRKKHFIESEKNYISKWYSKIEWRFLSYMGTKKVKVNIKCLQSMGFEFITYFDQESYLLCNPDVQKSLDNKLFDSALEHFILLGYDEIKEGDRRIGTLFPLFTETQYLTVNEDVKKAVLNHDFSSAFEHFIRFGYKEFLHGERELIGKYPFDWTDNLKNHVKLYFNENAYLEQNTDITSAVKEHMFENGWDHFLEFGFEEVRRGDRSLHPMIPKQTEKEYARDNKDIYNIEKYPHANTPFEHFLWYGAQEIISGKREVIQTGIYKYMMPKHTRKIQKEIELFSKKPLISIVMPVYNVDEKWLHLAIESLKAQWYPYWELCIADDASTKEETLIFLKSLNDPKIKVSFLKQNVNISGASNEALKLASGEYIALMDNDDELTVDALYEVVKSINETNSEFIYSDEDKLELDGRFTDPHFKSDFAPDMFLSQNYISHLSVIKKSLIMNVEGWTVGLEGAQDYDLYLKVLELTDKILHIPKVLYHWRKIPGSTAAEFSDKSYAQDAGKKALENAMKRRDIQAKILHGKYPGTYRVKYKIKGLPLVSIIIPFKDKPELLDMCINSILYKSTYAHYEIIGISNNSDEAKTFAVMETLKAKDSRVSFYEYNVPFNYSEINNYAVNTYAKGEHVILLNNDINIITPEWIESMLEFSQQDNIGTVGAKLYYPDDTIQHAGVAIGVLTLAGHNFRYLPRDTPGYMGRESVIQNISAVTAACLMVKKTIFDEVKGLNERDLKIAFNDIDFCLRIQEKGYLNIFTPYSEAYHYESISRGKEDNSEKMRRFNAEVDYMLERHHTILENGDPYYNQNLSLESEDFTFL